MRDSEHVWTSTSDKGRLTQLVLLALPYPEGVTNIDLEGDAMGIRFTWRGTRYRVTDGPNVEEVKPGILATTDRAILMQALLTIAYINTLEQED